MPDTALRGRTSPVVTMPPSPPSSPGRHPAATSQTAIAHRQSCARSGAAWQRLWNAFDAAFGGIPADLRAEPLTQVASWSMRPAGPMTCSSSGPGRHGTLGRLRHGKVSRYCLAHARCPVLAIRRPAPRADRRPNQLVGQRPLAPARADPQRAPSACGGPFVLRPKHRQPPECAPVHGIGLPVTTVASAPRGTDPARPACRRGTSGQGRARGWRLASLIAVASQAPTGPRAALSLAGGSCPSPSAP
jgi:hypothetical protein